ncbi:MAG: glycine cleavage T C-terminal barrel domain-containing protein, partial [Candidatus Nanopelagicales bacterium]
WDTAQTFDDPEFERSPYELAMAWNVDLDRAEDFIGRAALEKERADGSRFVMKGFEIAGDCELVDGAELFADINGDQVQVGTLPSVSWSHDAKSWIGLASLKSAHADIAEGYVQVNGDNCPCRITTLPFISLQRRRQVPAPM